ncbi:uncharacterized protein NECHADRAFT_75042 [Fusarium vanettenii 77-13-4]|uniref:Uncharacterized protein n=1 Tax=Fusarium vanettenii (strain ATCC MYA-4622 / CBS 123669 / FGSC 9596 / NRRL 45880 / 77-13-4) TaxID=660122 RepID=C7YHP4_FUSV7|nr:uncharacterized protein NECHADRAFT_75042 [Fusarium vanettenii 77-13-4]EEU48674.1 hypothetical protein NECHADRAFT_75042 [Fusarium vanettenii 77-13-4]
MTTAISTQPTPQALDDFVRAADLFHDQYVRTLRGLQDSLAPRRRETVEGAFTPPLRADSGPIFATDSARLSPLHRRPRASTFESTRERPSFTAESRPFTSSPSGSHRAVYTQDDDVNFIPLLDSTGTATTREVEDYALNVVRSPLKQMHLSDDVLLRYLRDTDFTPEMASLLDEAIKRRADINLSAPFRDFAAYERECYNQCTFEVYEVHRNLEMEKLSADSDSEDPSDVKDNCTEQEENPAPGVDAPTVWDTIRDVNMNSESVGRITIVQEPTPLALAALHVAMSSHFDMSELLGYLLTDQPNPGRTHAFMNRAYERPPSPAISSSPFISPSSPMSLPVELPPPPRTIANLRQRSFFFAFKYYTVVAPRLEPAPWQRFDKRPFDKRSGDHIDIAECGAVLALSLGGESTRAPPWRTRRERTKEGVLFETFGPWHLLAIQSFPDNSHTVRGEEYQRKKYINGPSAFLDLLISEYRDARTRNQFLHERVTKLITPPTEFMFDPKLRDKLLFEDKHFTYIRRYFWAYNTLAVVNNSIRAMMDAYYETFTDSFWAGTHATLWPHPSPETADAAAYREHMANLRRELDKVVQELGEVLKQNARTRKEIENLRDQLFSGSSIKESRRAIEQGDNIRILTMISMIFLPLTFVTSVFGMTVFTIPATDWRFALTMILVCVPFMLLITLLQTRSFGLLLRKLAVVGAVPARLLRRKTRDTDIPDSRSVARLRRSSGTWPWLRTSSGRLTWPWGGQPPRDEVNDMERGERV